MSRFVMALDAGTTSNRAIIFDDRSQVVAVARQELKQYYPQPGWVEHDACEIWDDMRLVMREALAKSGLAASQIAAIGITNQRETTVVWDRSTGKPIYHAIVWQSRQSVPVSEGLKARGLAAEFQAKTGLPVDAYFSGTKIAWLLDHVPGARRRAEKGGLLFGTIDTWLIWNLTGGQAHVTDYSNASRTLLYNIRELKWDEALLGYLDIPAVMLPEVRPSACIYGTTRELGTPVPVAGALGDQQAALFGQCCCQPGMAKNTYGTGCFLLMNTGNRIVSSRHGLAATIAWGMNSQVEYALEGSVFVAGSAVQWLRDEMKVIATAAESERLAASVPDNGGVYFVPAFTGLGAPYWDESARGMIIGLTRGSSRAHLARAVLEAIACQTKDVLEAVAADTGIRIAALNADGGASANAFLMQIQADLLGVPVHRAAMVETTALGAAYAALLAVDGKEALQQTLCRRRPGKIFTPQMEPNRAAALYQGWQRAVSHARNYLS